MLVDNVKMSDDFLVRHTTLHDVYTGSSSVRAACGWACWGD